MRNGYGHRPNTEANQGVSFQRIAVRAARYLSIAAFGSACALLLGCAAMPIELTPGVSRFDSRELIYDELVLDVVAPGPAAPMEVTAETSGDGAKEGVTMMLQAPVGCLEAGVLYGFCLAMAPLFPFMASNRVQDAAISQTELEAMAADVDSADIQRRFRESLEAQAREAGLPLVLAASPGARAATLHAEFGTTRFAHDGYQNGTITLTQPYRFSLSYGDAETEVLIEGERVARLEARSWSHERADELAGVFDEWIHETAAAGLRDTVLEWQPKVVLGPIAPRPVDKRNVIGIRQTYWPFVESTSPRLAWQPLEAVLDPEVFAEVSDVSYELEVFHPRGSRLVVRGLERPEYVVAEGLSPCAYYFWRPLARFRYRGALHTTSLNKRRWSKDVYLDTDFVIKTPSAECTEPSQYDPEPPRA